MGCECYQPEVQYGAEIRVGKTFELRLWVCRRRTVQDQDIWASDRLLGASVGFETGRQALTAMSSDGGCLGSPPIHDWQSQSQGLPRHALRLWRARAWRTGGRRRARGKDGEASWGREGEQGSPSCICCEALKFGEALRSSGKQGALRLVPCFAAEQGWELTVRLARTPEHCAGSVPVNLPGATRTRRPGA